ncbi:hypothetical protein MTO96_040820 [Rhipicephalus appendiculatus]
MDRVLEAVKTRRRAISALLARFAIDATFIGVTVSDVTTGIRWEVAHVIAFAAYVASICVCIRRYGVRVTLSSLLVILSAFCILETLTIIAGDDTSTRFVHAGLKVAVSGATAVMFCYTAETFPTAVRNVGISLAHLAGGVGNVVAIAVILYTEPHAGHVFYALSAFMVLLSVAAIQWLPEVHVVRPPRVGSPGSMSVQERKSGARSIAELWDSEPQAEGKQNEIFGPVLTVFGPVLAQRL